MKKIIAIIGAGAVMATIFLIVIPFVIGMVSYTIYWAFDNGWLTLYHQF